LAVFVTSLAVMGCVMERNNDAVGKGWERWMLEVVTGKRDLGLERRVEARKTESVTFDEGGYVEAVSDDKDNRDDATSPLATNGKEEEDRQQVAKA